MVSTLPWRSLLMKIPTTATTRTSIVGSCGCLCCRFPLSFAVNWCLRTCEHHIIIVAITDRQGSLLSDIKLLMCCFRKRTVLCHSSSPKSIFPNLVLMFHNASCIGHQWEGLHLLSNSVPQAAFDRNVESLFLLLVIHHVVLLHQICQFRFCLCSVVVIYLIMILGSSFSETWLPTHLPLSDIAVSWRWHQRMIGVRGKWSLSSVSVSGLSGPVFSWFIFRRVFFVSDILSLLYLSVEWREISWIISWTVAKSVLICGNDAK